MNKINYKKGFTLMDLLTSMAVISLLSSVIFFSVSEARAKAQDAQMQTETAQVSNAIELYKTSNDGNTPIKVWSSNESISSNISPGVIYKESSPEYQEVMNKLVEENYISQIPQSHNGESYSYVESTSGTDAIFIAQLRTKPTITSNDSNSCSIMENVYVDTQITMVSPGFEMCFVPVGDVVPGTYPEDYCVDQTGGSPVLWCDDQAYDDEYYCYYPSPSFTYTQSVPICEAEEYVNESFCTCN